jgi:flagellar biosynthesis anti-sigma factor FlgM
LEKVWSSWTVTVFDSGGHWVWGKEDTLRQRYGATCRIGVIGNSTAAATTSACRLLQRSTSNASKHAMDLSDVRMERVARIRAAIANGHYHVSSEDLAEKLIGVMLGARR